MARTRTAGEMLAQARVLSNTQDSTHVSAAEGLDLVSQACASLWDRLTTVNPMRFARRSTLTTTAGTREYDFAAASFSPTASDMMAVVGVSYIDGDDMIPLEPFSFSERGDAAGWEGTDGASVRWDVWYQHVEGDAARLVFDRDPAVGALYYVHYVRSIPMFALEEDIFDGINGWEDEAIYTVAIQLATAEESDETAALLRVERQEIRDRIGKLAPRRVIGRSKQVASVWTRGRCLPRLR